MRFCKRSLILEACAVAGWLAAVVLLHTTQKPRHQGFSCNDETIRYPYHRDTVDSNLLLTVSLLLPLLFFIPVELSERLYPCSGKKSSPSSFSQRIGLGRPTACATILSALGLYVIYFFGYLFQTFICVFLKNLVGRPRPFFVDVCKPDVDLSTCNGLVFEYTCTNLNATVKDLTSVRQSFPSGHASTSVHMVLFIVLFLEERLQHKIRPLCRLTLHAALSIWALWCSVSRVTDNAHHVTDVLAGAIIGIVTALVTYYRAAVMYLVPIKNNSSNSNNTNNHSTSDDINDIEQGVIATTNISSNNNNTNDKALTKSNISDDDNSESMEMETEAPTTPTPLLYNGVHVERPGSFRLGSFQLQRDTNMFRKFSLR